MHLFRQTATAKLYDRLGNCPSLQTLQAEKVSRVLREVRMLAAVNHMRVADNPAAVLLAEDLRQYHRRHHLTAQDRGKPISRTDGRQLSRNSDQDQSRPARQRLRNENICSF